MQTIADREPVVETDLADESVTPDRSERGAATGGSGRRNWRIVGLGTLVLVAVVGAVAVVGVTRVRGGEVASTAAEPTTGPATDPTWQPGSCSPPPSRAELTPEEQALSSQRSRDAISEGRRTGWLRFRGERGDGSGWFCGWMRYFPSGDPAALAASGGKEPLYDAPDGAVIGYSFATLGVFTPEQVAAPGFDPAQLRVARYGCDPVIDSSCRTVLTR